MKEFLDSFYVGLKAPLKGAELIFSKPRIRHAAIVPFFIVMVTYVIGAFLGLPSLFHFIPWLANMAIATAGLTKATFGAKFLYYILIIIAVPVGTFSLFFALYLVSQFMAAPFYAILVDRVLIESGLKSDQPFDLLVWIKTSTHLLAVSFSKILIFGLFGLILLVLSLLPGFGLLSAFGFLLMTAYDVVDLSLEGIGMGLRKRISFFRSEFPTFMGLALTLGLVFLIPGLNFFLFPASISGGPSIISWRFRNLKSPLI